MPDPVIKKIARGGDALLKFFFPFPPNQGIGIVACGNLRYPHDQVVLKKCVERAFSRMCPCRIRVEAETHSTHESLNHPCLSLVERRPLRRDDICDSRLKQTDQIELAFAHDRAV